MPLSLLLVIAVPIEALCAALLWRTWNNLSVAESQMQHLRAALAEIACYADARQRLKQRQQKVEQAIDSTTGSVETVHRALTDLSFDLWGKDAAQARNRHDHYADQVYGSVRTVNRLVGRWVSGLLDNDSKKDRD